MTSGQQESRDIATYGFNLAGLVVSATFVIAVPVAAAFIGAVCGYFFALAQAG